MTAPALGLPTSLRWEWTARQAARVLLRSPGRRLGGHVGSRHLHPSPPPPPPRAYKRREGLLIKSFVIFAVCRTAGPSDTHSLAPAARPLGARRLRETPLETCRADKGRREPDHSGTILGCDWHPVLRVQASVWGLGCAACARSPFAGCPSRVRGTELVRGKHVPRVSDC